MIVSCLLIKCCKYFVFCSLTSAVFTAVLTMSSMIPTRHRWNCQELKYIIFRSTLVLSSVLIHVLAHFQRTTCSQNYFRFSSYLLRKTAFICNIDRDWMIYRKHPIRSLLTSMLRRASFRYPSDVYALSFENYKGKWLQGISQRQKCIVMYMTVQVRSEFGKFAYTAICMRNVYTLIW
jgi:hypothetical protein